mgnify:CR=1 FL=1|tara:strand:- start:1082 stop:1918 length:837 start_codon:yes stop_codon:yes gene_type:complete
MLDKITEKSPAKINLFLKILNKREDGYHNIRTGVTFINIHDEISIQSHQKFEVIYSGNFSPKNNKFNDCIVTKLFSFLNIIPPKILISIKKNFPYQAGLGSASSNVATVIKILENLEIIERKNIFDYVKLGSDIPLFLNEKDSLVRGKGDLISNIIFPKYYFLLIKPNFICSTEKMYNSFSLTDFDYDSEFDIEEINDQDNGNDFEKILRKTQPEFTTIYEYLENLEGVIFTRLTGSGSCLFSVFEKKEDAENAKTKFSNNFPTLWNVTTENNLLNIF